MKISIFARRDITSKKGNFTILSGVKPSGEGCELFLNEEQIRKFSLSSGFAPSADVVKKLVAALPVLDVDFNERGRVEGVSVPA